MKKTDIRQDIHDLLLQCLKAVPAVSSLDFPVDPAESQADFVINVNTERETYRLIVGIRGSGQPRYARETVALLWMQSGRLSENTYPVFAAPFISKPAAEICLEGGAGYIDLAGNCRLTFDGIYIERQGRPNRFVTRRSLKSLYETRSSRVLRALLFDPNLAWKLTDLSEASGVSIGQVYNVKQALIDREWAVFDKEGLKLTRPEGILRDWGENYALSRNARFDFRSSETPPELESRLAGILSEKGMRYALTSFSASVRLASMERHPGMYAYVEGDMDRLAGLVHLEPADSEPNVTLMVPHDEGVFFGMKEIDGVNVVSPVQAYLDLAGIGEKGKETAETVFRQVIQKEWQAAASPTGS